MPELVKFTKTGGPLTKHISLAPDGTLVRDGSACVMTRGTAERVKIAGIDELAALIGSLHPSQAIALGALRDRPARQGRGRHQEELLNGVARPDTHRPHRRQHRLPTARRSRCSTSTPRACRPRVAAELRAARRLLAGAA